MGAFVPAKGTRIFPKVVLTVWSECQSSRQGTPISFIVLHSTEGPQRKGRADLEAVANWLRPYVRQASAHVVCDNDGTTARLVRDRMKAWHVGNLNPPSVGIEMIGYAAQGRKAWRECEHELHEVARHIALMSIVHRIPIQPAVLTRSGSIVAKGVTTHAYCSAHGAGTDHTDPGEFPMGRVLWLAKGYKRAQGRAMK